MSDISFIPSAAPKKDDKDEEGKKASDDESALHIPGAEPPEPEGGRQVADLLSGLKGLLGAKEELPKSIFEQKIEPLAMTPKSVPKPAPKPAAPAPPPTTPPPAPPPKPPAPPPKPSVPQPPAAPKAPKFAPPKPPATAGDGGGTLRVSLIAGTGGGMTDMAVRARLRSFVLIAMLGLVLDGLVYGGLLFYKSRVEKGNVVLQQNVRDLDAAIAAAEAQVRPARELQRLARAAESALDAHQHWTKLFSLLEDLALPEAQFGALSGSESGTFNFEVYAKDYTSLAKQVVAFRQDPRVESAVIGTASADFGENNLLKGARTSMALMLDPKIFLRADEAAATTK